jgi:HEAT repeat protein
MHVLLLHLLLLGPPVAWGGAPQTTPPAPASPMRGAAPKSNVEVIRKLIASGGLEEARHLLRVAPATREFQQLRFDLELKTGDVPAALTAWETLRLAAGPDWTRLRSLARSVALQLRRDPDAAIRVQACAVLLRSPGSDCVRELQNAGGDADLDWHVRLAALRAVADTGATGGKDALIAAATEAVTTDPGAAFSALSDADPVRVVGVFASLLADSPNPQAQFQAALLVGDAGVRSPEARHEAARALDAFVARSPREPLKTAAIISLARVGEARDVNTLRDLLPRIGGYERLMAAVALAERGTPGAVASLKSATSDLSEQFQLEAAVRIARWDRQRATELVDAQAAAANPVTKLAAMHVWPQIKAEPSAAIRTALADPDAGVRAAAAVAVTSPFATDVPAPK